MASLGFSDLNEDEALLVAIYRDWAQQSGAKEVVEDLVARALSHDVLHRVLGTVFAIYRQNTPEAVDPCGIGDLLSDHEERLLDALSEMVRSTCPQSDEANIAYLLHAIRPADQICRSGQDELLHKMNIGSWSVSPVI